MPPQTDPESLALSVFFNKHSDSYMTSSFLGASSWIHPSVIVVIWFHMILYIVENSETLFCHEHRVLVPENGKGGSGNAACTICDAAFATLKDPVKKALYDQYIYQSDAPEGMTYEQWERSLAVDERDVPKLVHKILDCPGGAAMTCCVFVPGLIVSILITGLVWLVMMPLRLIWKGFWRCWEGAGNKEWHTKMRLEESGKEFGDAVDRVNIRVESTSRAVERLEVLELKRGGEDSTRELNSVDGDRSEAQHIGAQGGIALG